MAHLGEGRIKQTLYWRARRGMLELDIMLQAFLDHDYDAISEAEQFTFVELLAYPDQELLELLLGQAQAEQPAIADVVQKIRHTTLAKA